MYGWNGVVHDTHMAGRAAAKAVKPARAAKAENKVLSRLKAHPPYRLTFIRQWRESAPLTLERLADRIGSTHATLSRIERGLLPYSQPMLEALANALNTDPASLLIRDPRDPEGIWSIWDKAAPGERRMIVDLAKTVVRTGT